MEELRKELEINCDFLRFQIGELTNNDRYSDAEELGERVNFIEYFISQDELQEALRVFEETLNFASKNEMFA